MDKSTDAVTFYRLWHGVLKKGWWVVGISVLGSGIAAMMISLLQTPIYQSTATLYVTSGGANDSANSAYQGSLASEQRVASYAQLVLSEAVVSGAVSRLGPSASAGQLVEVVESRVVPETVMLEVSANDEDPERAALLANAVAASIVDYVGSLEAPVSGGDPFAKLTVVSPATSRPVPVSPRVKRNVAIGFVLGGCAGLLVLLFRARFDNRVRADDDVESQSGLVALGTVLDDPAIGEGGPVDFISSPSVATEGYRRLRTNLAFAMVDDPAHVVLVTSANAGEGKSTTALNLAASLVEGGNRVVLVDADLRKPSQASRLGLSSAIGLTTYLSNPSALSDLLQPTEIAGLEILAAGPSAPNPSELLGSARTGQLLRNLADSHDYVIVDSSPVIPVTDAAVVSQFVDGVILVANCDSTEWSEVSQVVKVLGHARASILGIVLNRARKGLFEANYGYYGERVDM
ncbi:polysaccharide biosynthesis tyrosine autokinase [Gordonia sp. HNM0687]|uniref:Polysaccharide biosynthesis tyrosine autokinase n=1 Tax=Gordonia mangrovi TaxID=2665643 RepID=A0A6L7GK26_9ACTN|nr:polysaccharide biosynthesis tyrosine autokinase [Gordonia mangrovi]MXP20256.1 polysaccharide biosynthesis tyrosine autokinase [Gordonia mangrovi]UVF79138.1 polysaccharide biosynthesis tyrosine autokinase [Gordonia mangrovi]